jgi:cytochrome P450
MIINSKSEADIRKALPKTIVEEIVNQLVTFLFAGTDTTANLSTMMLYMLSE